MDEMTQQNAALVEEASAASEAMSEQATNMNQLVSFFRLGDVTETYAMPTAPKSREKIKTYQPNPIQRHISKAREARPNLRKMRTTGKNFNRSTQKRRFHSAVFF